MSVGQSREFPSPARPNGRDESTRLGHFSNRYDRYLEDSMSKKFSRRDFARTSAASAAAAVALPNVLFGEASTVASSAAAKGAAVAREAVQRGRFAPPPPNFSYGGDPSSAVAEYRDSILLAHAPAMMQGAAGATAQAPAIIRGWREGKIGRAHV